MAAIAPTLLLMFTIEPTLIFFIYSYFPSQGVYMDQYMNDPGYEFDKAEFRRRWLSAIIFISLLVGVRLYNRKIKNKTAEAEESKQLAAKGDEEIKRLHDRLKSRELNTHFIENFVVVALHRERKRNKENVEMLSMLTNLMYYQLSMDNEQQATGWQKEWEQVENLLQMACYKDQKFVYEWSHEDGIADMDVIIPHGLLLMPLENALKYGKNTAEWALRIEFSRKADRVYIQYSNYFDPVLRSRLKSTGKGFQLMEARLMGGSWPITLRKWEEDNRFYVDIEIACGKR